MTSDLELFKKLIKQNATLQLERTSYDKTILILEETSVETPYSVTIKGVPRDAFVIKVDKFQPPDDIIKCMHGECKRADYVIIAQSDRGRYMIYIEMKKGGGKRKAIVQQLKGAACFVAYCRELVRTFFQQPEFLTLEYENRYVSIKNIGIKKIPTSLNLPTKTNNTPEDMLTISGKEVLHFNELTMRRK